MFVSRDIANLMNHYFVLVIMREDTVIPKNRNGNHDDRKMLRIDIFVSSGSIVIQEPELAPLV